MPDASISPRSPSAAAGVGPATSISPACAASVAPVSASRSGPGQGGGVGNDRRRHGRDHPHRSAFAALPRRRPPGRTRGRLVLSRQRVSLNSRRLQTVPPRPHVSATKWRKSRRFADRTGRIEGPDAERQDPPRDGLQLDLGAQDRPGRRRGRMAHVDVDADRMFALVEMRAQRCEAGRLEEPPPSSPWPARRACPRRAAAGRRAPEPAGQGSRSSSPRDGGCGSRCHAGVGLLPDGSIQQQRAGMFGRPMAGTAAAASP